MSTSFQCGGIRGEVTAGRSSWVVVMTRVAITGAWVVVLLTTATLVDTVGSVVDVVVLARAGRPPAAAAAAVVPASNKMEKMRHLDQTLLNDDEITFVQIIGFAAHFEDDFHVVGRATSADASV